MSVVDIASNATKVDIISEAKSNRAYRKILNVGEHSKIIVMNVKDTIPLEIHKTQDQFLFVVRGQIKVTFHTVKKRVIHSFIINKNEGIFIPALTYHKVVNKSDKPSKVFSIYSGIEEY